MINTSIIFVHDLIEKKNHNSNVTRKETDDHKEPMTLS